MIWRKPAAETGADASPDDLAWLQRVVQISSHEPGSLVVERGGPADCVFLLLQGEVSVILDLPQGGNKRLSTLSAGMSFGELALLTGGVRSAHVRADTAVVCAALSVQALARLESERPGLMILLQRNLLRSLAATTTRLTAEVAALEG